jgi:hypothetical protein
MTGDEGRDIFTFGVNNEVFYNNEGNSDFGLMEDFEPSQDFVQLLANPESTTTDSFSLGATPDGVPQETAIFFEDDLIWCNC